jgi:hypothetical protein
VGTIAERSLEYMTSKEMDGKRYAQRIADLFGHQLSMNPVPQLVKPIMDLYANKDSFTGRAIESMGMEKLRKQDRAGPGTSEVAKFLGGMGLPDPTALIMGRYDTLSPVQVDHLVRGYFSWLGVAATTAIDYGIRPMISEAERPAMRLKDVFLAGSFMETLPTGSSRYVTELYERAREIENAYGSYRDAMKRGDFDKAREIREEEKDKITKYTAIESVKRQEAAINAQIRRIQAATSISAETKRTQIDQLEQRRNDIAERFITR